MSAGHRAHPLDNPARGALTGAHAHLAERRGRVLRYPVDVSPWLALPDDPGPDDWADLAALAGPGGRVALSWVRTELPAGWQVIFRTPGVQLVGEQVEAVLDEEAVRLTAADVPQMLDRSHAPSPARSCRAP